MNAHPPNANSLTRQRWDVLRDPRYLALKGELAAVRQERRHWKAQAARQRARAELWRLRCLTKRTR